MGRIKGKLESIRKECAERESCFAYGTVEKECRYRRKGCWVHNTHNSILAYPFDWSDRFINWLASELEEQKSTWHDLRKNPRDLPESGKWVLAFMVEFYVPRYRTVFYEGECWDDGLTDYFVDEVIAWREIEPFEPF